MAQDYAQAVAALYRSAQEQFVSERKRLAAELKAGGDKAGAARLAKLARPSLSAWAVNQLWWQARPAFDELLAAGERLRRGDRSGQAAHRDALAALRTRASSLLSLAGHAVTDATLRRVSTTLAALAAAGSFAPDEPGALSVDRDPPGFEALGAFGTADADTADTADAAAAPEVAAAPEPVAALATAAGQEPAVAAAARAAAEAEAKAKAEARAEAERREAERREAERREQKEREAQERREAERAGLNLELATVRQQLASRSAAVERLRAQLTLEQQGVESARSQLADLEQRLSQLETGAARG